MENSYQERQEFVRGVNYFNSRDYFEAHEVWEDLWNELGGVEHQFLQGLIQVAVALHHASNGNFRGMKKLFASSLTYLEKGQLAKGRVDREALIGCILDFQNAADATQTGENQSLPYFSLPMSP